MSCHKSKMASSRSKKSKRSQSPGSACPAPSKRKRPLTPCVADEVESNSSSRSSPSSYSVMSEASVNPHGQFSFKDSNFEHSGVNPGKKKIWKNLKQIMTLERGLAWKQDDPTYSSIDAPPSFKPSKKYADLFWFTSKIQRPKDWNTIQQFSGVWVNS